MIYASSFFEGDTLVECAKEYLKALPPEVTHLVTTGSSGSTIASAMLVIAEQQGRVLQHHYVRKEGENAHGRTFAGSSICGQDCAIVDDLVSSGNTVEYLINHCKNNNAILKAIIFDQYEHSTNKKKAESFIRKLLNTNPLRHYYSKCQIIDLVSQRR
jgi:orotate phosphoribosyltransferase